MIMARFLRLTLLLQLFRIQLTLCFHSTSFSSFGKNAESHKHVPKNTLLLAVTQNDSDTSSPPPTTFREAEILGLKLMQNGKTQEALDVFKQGLKLPGSKYDIIRTKTLAGPSPVGGSAGGTEGKEKRTLDAFELQAAYYNMACAHSRLGNLSEAIDNLRKAWDNGFDNISTFKSDPDLRPLQDNEDMIDFLKEIQQKKLFNPFGLFNKK